MPGVYLLKPQVFEDNRGFFMETFNSKGLAELGIDRQWVQDNHSRSARGVLRGLHYQLGRPQAKLVRATRGRVFDVAVDIRPGSPHFGQWTGAELSEENKLMLFAPEGFAHGFVVLSDVAEFQYKCSDYWAPAEERAIAWNDPDIGIEWPVEGFEPQLSGKDAANPKLAEVAKDQLPKYRP
uniref:dTDP-4-dehydrorhamnose 3,5-epimerase n=1 Tax=uncultured sulfate-reducing bacterium TaxID=153939 RepID=Q3IBP6_9BACT|nr:probable dTDP-4-dehydrorhamnose 3,5-epimerase [uncultured sulfate-reducing bacterium]